MDIIEEVRKSASRNMGFRLDLGVPAADFVGDSTGVAGFELSWAYVWGCGWPAADPSTS
jgi:hypothetical protein